MFVRFRQGAYRLQLSLIVRFRQGAYRLQLSLIETRRSDGKVRHEHVASLGSISLAPSVADRIEFWYRLYQCLARFSNRVGAEDHGKIFGSVNARVPMPTTDEQRALQLENAKADANFWVSLEGIERDKAEGHKGLAAKAEQAATAGQVRAAAAASKAAAAKERIERIEKGENVIGGLGKPLTREDFERILMEEGWTRRDIRREIRRAETSPKCPESFSRNLLPVLIPEIMKRYKREATERDVLELFEAAEDT